MWVRDKIMGRLWCLSCGAMVDPWRAHDGNKGPWRLHGPCIVLPRWVGPWFIHGATVVGPWLPVGVWLANGVPMMRSDVK